MVWGLTWQIWRKVGVPTLYDDPHQTNNMKEIEGKQRTNVTQDYLGYHRNKENGWEVGGQGWGKKFLVASFHLVELAFVTLYFPFLLRVNHSLLESDMFIDWMNWGLAVLFCKNCAENPMIGTGSREHIGGNHSFSLHMSSCYKVLVGISILPLWTHCWYCWNIILVTSQTGLPTLKMKVIGPPPIPTVRVFIFVFCMGAELANASMV